MACFFIVFIMSLEQYDLQDTAKILTWVFMIFPHFALVIAFTSVRNPPVLLYSFLFQSHGLGNINIVTAFNQICDMQCKLLPGCTKEIMCEILPLFNSSAPCCGKTITTTNYDHCCQKLSFSSDNDYFKWNNFGIARNLLFMSCTGIGFFVILLVTEYSLVSSSIYSIKKIFMSAFSRNETDEPIDYDVVQEKSRVKDMSEADIKDHNLVLMNMTKLYGKFVAVHDMSVAVEQFSLVFFLVKSIINSFCFSSECFGLLGVNGAGKVNRIFKFVLNLI